MESTARHPAYIGVSGGYGSTTWGGLVPDFENQNLAMSMSTPIQVNEGGGVWGAFAGYEISPFFAFELSYMNYPNAEVTFDKISLFSFDNDDLTQFTTHTETVSLMGKVMLMIPKTQLKVYSSLGIAELHRRDMLTNQWHVSPTFGAGFNYAVTPHVIAELGGSYTAGYGEAQLNPTEVYFPFLYATYLRLGYRF